MPRHNGYKPISVLTSSPAALHPTCARLGVDDEGLLPTWVVYQEYVSTARTFIRNVCPVEHSWMVDAIARLEDADVRQLAGGDAKLLGFSSS